MGKIAFIDSSDSFIIKSIIKELDSTGSSCITIDWSADEIRAEIDNISGAAIAFIDDTDDIEEEAASVLKELTSKGIKLCLMGRKDDIAEVKETYSLDMVADEFCRPINAGETAEKIRNLISDSSVENSKKHILVVDDSGLMLATIQEWLGSKYRVSIVNSAMNAVMFLNNSEILPDLILLDYEMPVCSGPQLLEMLRADDRTKVIPVIFLTGRNDSESVQKVLQLKPEGFLFKNMPKDYIIGKVDEFFS